MPTPHKIVLPNLRRISLPCLTLPSIGRLFASLAPWVESSKLPSSTDSLGSFRPLMPSLTRLLAGIIVLVVVDSIVLGFPGLTQTIAPSSITIISLVTLLVGLIAAIIVFKYGTQLSHAASEAYRSLKNYEELLTYFFQIAALYILYITSRALVTASGVFRSAPWAYPMIFLAIAIIPTIKVVINTIHKLEGNSPQRRSKSTSQF